MFFLVDNPGFHYHDQLMLEPLAASRTLFLRADFVGVVVEKEIVFLCLSFYFSSFFAVSFTTRAAAAALSRLILALILLGTRFLCAIVSITAFTTSCSVVFFLRFLLLEEIKDHFLLVGFGLLRINARSR